MFSVFCDLLYPIITFHLYKILQKKYKTEFPMAAFYDTVNFKYFTRYFPFLTGLLLLLMLNEWTALALKNDDMYMKIQKSHYNININNNINCDYYTHSCAVSAN